jgi:hypothetical protein
MLADFGLNRIMEEELTEICGTPGVSGESFFYQNIVSSLFVLTGSAFFLGSIWPMRRNYVRFIYLFYFFKNYYFLIEINFNFFWM